MKNSIYILSLFYFIVVGCSNSTDSKPPADDSTVIEEAAALQPMNLTFPELYQYYKSQDSSFIAEGFEEGETVVKSDSAALKMDSAELKTFSPYLLYNADSSYALDLVSYNFGPERQNGKIVMQEMGPDFEAAIIDMKKKERKRILFFGPSGGAILDAKWIDNSTAVIAGAIDWSGADSLRPVMWKFDTKDKTLQQFTYDKMIGADWSRYPKKIYELNK